MATIQLYDEFLLNWGKKVFDFNPDHGGGDSLNVALFKTGSNCANKAASPATYTNFAGDGQEVADGHGYAGGGTGIAGASLTSNGDIRVGAPHWDITTTGFTFRYAVLYDPTAGNKAIGYWDLGTTNWVTAGQHEIITTQTGGSPDDPMKLFKYVQS